MARLPIRVNFYCNQETKDKLWKLHIKTKKKESELIRDAINCLYNEYFPRE